MDEKLKELQGLFGDMYDVILSDDPDAHYSELLEEWLKDIYYIRLSLSRVEVLTALEHHVCQKAHGWEVPCGEGVGLYLLFTQHNIPMWWIGHVGNRWFEVIV